jgi:hypothetical protein
MALAILQASHLGTADMTASRTVSILPPST